MHSVGQKQMIGKVRQLCKGYSEDKIAETLKNNNWNDQKTINDLMKAGQQGPQQLTQINQQLQNIPIFQQQQKLTDMMMKPQEHKSIEEILKSSYSLENHEWYHEDADRLWNKLQSDHQQDEAQLRNRVLSIPVGVVNLDQSSYFSCLVTIIFQNPILVENILRYKRQGQMDDEFTKSQQLFMKELKIFICKLMLTNQKYLSPHSLSVAAKDYFQKCQFKFIPTADTQFISLYEMIIFCLDLAFTNSKELRKIVKDQCSFTSDMLGPQYNLIKNKRQEQVWSTHIPVQSSERLLFCSLFNMARQENDAKYGKMPKNLAFSVQRGKIQNDYWFSKTVNLDILTGERNLNDYKAYLEKSSNEVEQTNQGQQNLNAITLLLAHYESQDITPSDVIRSFKQEYSEQLQKMKTLYPRNMEESSIQKNITQNSQNKFSLQTIVIEITKQEVRHFYLYLFNFHLNSWFRVCGKDIQLETEEMVFRDAIKNACLLLYVHEEQQVKIKKYQQQLEQCEKWIQIYQGELLKEHGLQNEMLQWIEPELIGQICSENRQFIQELKQ